MTGTLIDVAAVLLGTAIGVTVGRRLPGGLQQRVLAGLGLVTAVIGVDLALAWRDTSPLYVLGAILLGGVIGEAVGIEARLARLGDRLQERISRTRDPTRDGRGESTVSEAFFTASLLFCVGPLTVGGAFEDGLKGNVEPLATIAAGRLRVDRARLDARRGRRVRRGDGARRAGRADARRGPLRGRAARRGAERDDLDRRRADHRDLAEAAGPQGREGGVGNILPALVLAPMLVGIVSLL